MTAIKYKPHIDGLRAVAVLLVIFHHLGDWGVTQGGFIGVDVFFVISGFLIAKQVYTHLESGPTTAMRFLAWFYERRARRILPAMMFVSALTFLAAYVLFLPDRFTQFASPIVPVSCSWSPIWASTNAIEIRSW